MVTFYQWKASNSTIIIVLKLNGGTKIDESVIIRTYNEGINADIGLVKESVSGLTEQIIKLQDDNQNLNKRIIELEARLDKNSNNSSKSPSSDGLKKKPKNMREKTGNRSGGQQGHEGRILNKVENPDITIDIKPQKCKCGYCLSNIEGTPVSGK